MVQMDINEERMCCLVAIPGGVGSEGESVVGPNRDNEIWCWGGKAVSLIHQSDIFKGSFQASKTAAVHCNDGQECC